MVSDILTYAKVMCEKRDGELLVHGKHKLVILSPKVHLFGMDNTLIGTISTECGELNMKGFPLQQVHDVIKAWHDKQLLIEAAQARLAERCAPR